MASDCRRGGLRWYISNNFLKCRICCQLPTQLFALLVLANLVSCQLVINVKNKGGDLIQESLNGNPAENTISLKFQKLDGTLLNMLIDFKSVSDFIIINHSINPNAESREIMFVGMEHNNVWQTMQTAQAEA